MTNVYNIRSLRNQSDIDACVNMAVTQLSKSNIVPFDRETCNSNLQVAVRLKKPIRLLEHNSKIIAWIYGEIGSFLHTNYPIMVQRYFASNVKGVKAVKAIQLLHRELIVITKENKIPLLHSMGSYYDSSDTFVRILERDGWTRQGYLAVFQTGHPFRLPETAQAEKLGGTPYGDHGANRVPTEELRDFRCG